MKNSNALSLPDWAKRARRTATVDGIQTNYFELGTGPSLVLVHGGGPGADSWGNWNICLQEYARNFHVIAYDMPGFGRTAKPSPTNYPYDQESRNRHLIALLEQLGLQQVNLIGNSMGGATSLGACIQRPDLVKKLVLMGAAGLDVNNPDPTPKDQLRKYDFTLEAMRTVVKTLTGSQYVPSDEVILYRHELMQDPEAQAALLQIVRSKLVYDESQIAQVKTPTLVVSGKEDQIAVPARSQRYLELLENSSGFAIPHVGHWVMLEAPEVFVEITMHFMLNDW
ncbi:alpha/beta fold hydrolase [Pusillimonas sp.]|uniref:alpha/beta fold hydrolase n=1 Tax=Pusillimonas sp. TaxID=3040095 RepID=UPI0037C5E45A